MPHVLGSSTLDAATIVDELASFRSEIDALADSEVITPRVDVSAAALTAIGAMPQIEVQRPLLVSAFGDRATRELERLPLVARTLLLAHARFVAVTERDLEPLARELMEVRTSLVSSQSALVERGVVDKKTLGNLIGGQSYQARMVDTLVTIAWFRANASIVAPYTRISASELDSAQVLALEFGQAVSERDLALAGSGTQARDRARTFTLFLRSYEHVRRLLTFVRWRERDADRIAPSIYLGRGTRKSDDVAPPQPAASPQPIASPPPVASPQPTNVIPPGMPGADPFRTT